MSSLFESVRPTVCFSCGGWDGCRFDGIQLEPKTLPENAARTHRYSPGVLCRGQLQDLLG